MKYKTTAKEVKDGYYYLAKIGYCDLQHLLEYNPDIRCVAYASGVYGWNFDIYEIDGESGTLAICTGYRPCGYPLNFDKVREFDKKARELTYKNKSQLTKEFYNFAIEEMQKAFN